MTVRFAFAGLDHWYNGFGALAEVLRHPNAEVVAVAHVDRAQASDIEQRFGVTVGTSLEDAITRDDVDIVACNVSTDQNARLCRLALEAGKAVVAIKPMAMTLAEADEVVATVAHTGGRYLPNDAARRLSSWNLQFTEWIRAGKIGRVLSAHLAFRAPLPQVWPGASEPGWFADPARHPGGAFIDHAIYHVDVLRWLFGAEVESVTGMTANLRHDLPVEDYGHGIFTFANGAVGTIEDTWTAEAGAPREIIEIVGERGALAMDSATGKMSLTGDFGLPGWLQASPPAATTGFVQHAIRCMTGDEEPISTPADARANLAACLAFYESARSGQAVRVGTAE